MNNWIYYINTDEFTLYEVFLTTEDTIRLYYQFRRDDSHDWEYGETERALWMKKDEFQKFAHGVFKISKLLNF